MSRFFRSVLDFILSTWAAFVAKDRAAYEEDRIRYHVPRLWKFVNAFGPQQATTSRPMNHADAIQFLRSNLGYAYVQTDFEGSIIFFAGPKGNG